MISLTDSLIQKEAIDIMQHEMNMQHGTQNQPRPSFVYEGEQVQPSSAYHLYGQKLPGMASAQAPTAGQRLALAIVSLSLLVFLIFGLVIFSAVDNAPNWAVIPVVFIIMLFSAVVAAINIVFNRRA